MKTNVLTQFGAKNLPAGKHADGQGLWLVKSERARGKWLVRVVVNGKRREMGLGRWPDVSIMEARQRAADARKLVRDAVDPVEARKKARRPVYRLTVKEAVEGCLEARKAQLKGDGIAGRWLSPLKVHVFPKIGELAVEDLDQHELKRLLDPIWHEKPEAAAKALSRLNLTLHHAAALGLSVDLQACTKARALLGKQRHETAHIPALSYADAPDFYKWLRTTDGISAKALRFLILTCARTTEVRLAESNEVSGGIWTLPAVRTKTQTERRIPLTTEALTIVEGGSDYLFPAYKAKPITDMAMSTLMKRAGYDARPHGFRSTFRTWAEENSDADYETKESCLGHAVDTGVQAAYQRSDRLEKRRKLLTQWEGFLLG